MYRTLQVEMWQDPWFADLSPQTKCLFMYLITNPRSKPDGYEMSLADIEADTGLLQGDLISMFDHLRPRVSWDGKNVVITRSDWNRFAKPYRPSGEAWMEIRRRVFKRDDYTCRYCGDRGGRLECDHVVPVSRGGGNGDDNLVTSCFKCNRSKRSRLVEEWI